MKRFEQIKALACDLDGTLAKTYEPLSKKMQGILSSFTSEEMPLLILTDEIEDNIDRRVSRFFKDKSGLYISSDGGAVFFGYTNQQSDLLYKYCFSSAQKRTIEDSVALLFGNFILEHDQSKHRLGLKIANEPSLDELRILDHELEIHGLPDILNYVGRGILRFNPFGKHKALGFFLEKTGLQEEDLLIIADQTAPYRIDWRLFDKFKKAKRVHVGTKELMIDDTAVYHPGDKNEYTTFDFLKNLKRKFIIDNSFCSNERLYAKWVNDLRIKTGVNNHEIEQKMRFNSTRYPVLPEEQAICLLPFIKKLIDSPSIPVIMARGMLPAVDIITAISEHKIFGHKIGMPLVIKTASFEDIMDYNPLALSRKDYLERDLALAITINTLLGEDIYNTLTVCQQRIRDRNGLKANKLGSLIQEIGSDCISENNKRHLRKFYIANFSNASFAFHKNIFHSNIFLENLHGLTDLELTAVRCAVVKYNGKPILDWENVWEIYQVATRAFNIANPIRFETGNSFKILSELLSTTSLSKKYGNKSWIGLDDSQLSGRSALLFQTIAEAVSPGMRNAFGVFSSTKAYGQANFVDFVLSDHLLFPEKELDLYDGIYNLNNTDEIWSFRFTPFNMNLDGGRKPNLEHVKTNLSNEYSILEPFFRKDTNLNPFEFIIYNYLIKGHDNFVNLVLEEYLPIKGDNPHFLDLGSSVIEFKRNRLPWFEGKISAYTQTYGINSLCDIDMDSFRHYLHQTFYQETIVKREQYKKRQEIGVKVIANNPEILVDYFADAINFETLRNELVCKL